METWGELFWDAWIRFRLWCRSVRRLYWPPRIEAWQVCTVTGVAAIVLTVLSLRNQIGSSAHAGQPIADKTPNQAPSKQLSSKKSQSKLASTPAVEPYEMAQIVDGATPVDTEITLEDPNTKTDSAPPKPDSEFDDIGPSRPPRTDLRHAARPGKLSTALDTPASDSTAGVDTAEPESEQGSPKATVDGTTDLELKDTSNSVPDPKEIDTAVRSRIAVKPSAEQFESAPDISDVQMPDKELPNKESGDTAESALDRLPKSKVTLDVAGDEQSAEGATPAKLLPARDPGHYTRSHHEEDEPVNSEVPVARRKKIEFAAPAPAPKSIVRSKGHYTSFGDDEPAADAKSDAVIPTRQTNVVPPAPPESNEPDVVESVAKEPAEPDMPKAPNADTEDFEVPKVPTKRAPRVAVPMDEQPQFEPPARELSLPPAESDVMLTPEAEPDDGPHPPILIAPEEEFENPGVTPPVSEQPVLRSATPPEFDEQKTNVDAEAITTNRRTPPVVENSQPTKTVAPVTGDDSENEPVPPLPNKRFQGPVLSTDSVDHEAHLNEDVFNGGKRKQRDIPNLPPAKSIDYHGPVLSTGAADHEAHQAEDSISGGNSKTDNKTNGRNWPTAKAVKPSLEHQARQPVSTEPAENEKINAEPAGPAVEPEADPGVVTPPVATPKEPAAALKPTRDYDSAEPATSRRTAPRTAPRSSPQIIGHDTDAAETTSP
ncbi:MAG: hypothetical protein JWM11_3749, partial [Planctomycetaceae bacterium]|nr:hypothetical protein [Planctomycetaceae bacterium]